MIGPKLPEPPIPSTGMVNLRLANSLLAITAKKMSPPQTPAALRGEIELVPPLELGLRRKRPDRGFLFVHCVQEPNCSVP
jgi:hypothetical protein